ncbi:MAG TPA: transcription termination factor Rho [Planctomycetota bacterium]|nr:transcription termination factor Rho [Planctomycetota bacterium]
MASDDLYSSEAWQSLPFGAMERPQVAPRGPAEERRDGGRGAKPAGRDRAPVKDEPESKPMPASETARDPAPNRAADESGREDWRRPDKRRGSGRRGGRRRRRGRGGSQVPDGAMTGNPANAPIPPAQTGGPQAGVAVMHDDESGEAVYDEPREAPARGPSTPQHPREAERAPAEGEGMLMVEKGGFGTLRQIETSYLPSRSDIFVPLRLIQQFRLRDGSIVRGRLGRGQKHKFALLDVTSVDGRPPMEVRNLPDFKSLVTIDPDFHYAVGDPSGETAMRILDVICPIGRGQRGLIVAPPRAGKTTILRQFAKGIEKGYPDVRLLVLLVDERPEEATEWKRSTNGQVFVSTADETAKTHVALAEAVWKRATRLVELGEEVVLLLDSITRLARAYNNLSGGSGRTMSGGLDSQAMQRPRQIFGSARNTETAGSLTILGTTLVETGSKMDQLIFEEFKGTGNMELVLSRKLADRRIFPAIDIEKSGTRKEEKLLSARRLKSVQTLRRVLLRMSFIEAMDLLVTKLDDVEATDDFLKRFEVDPDA